MSTLLLGLLLAATPAPAAATPATPPAPPAKEKMICKRETEIGKLVPGRRVCITESEYRARMEQAQRDTAVMQTPTGNTPQ